MNVRHIYSHLIKPTYCILEDTFIKVPIGIHSLLRVLGGFSHFWVQNFTLLVDVGEIRSLEHYMHADGSEVHTSDICHLLTFFKSVRNPM